MTRSSIDVCLVACTPDGTEPLGAGYLASALRQTGHRPHVVTFDSWSRMGEAARRVAAIDPPLAGLSIPSGQAAMDALPFAGMLRRFGWKGHLTSGGAWATLCRKRILDSCPAMDSVIRHDGEIPIVHLANTMAAGQDPAGLPGITTRHGDGQPAQVTSDVFTGSRPERRRFKMYAGVPSAKISAVRGCRHGCRYCGVAALRRERMAEWRNGATTDPLGTVEGPGRSIATRRRPVGDVADEMACLYHDHGVRFFHFVDENHLPDGPGSEAEALDAIHGLEVALERRGVGRRALSLMLRADAATGPVVEALARLGVVRSLLGVESMVPKSLDSLARGSSPTSNMRAVENMVRHDISFHFNVLLVHPYSTFDDIAEEVASLRSVAGGLLDPFQVEVFEGTDLHEKLSREGRLGGGPFIWHYENEDPRADAFARIFYLLKHQALGKIPLTAFAYEILGHLAVARHLGMIGSGEDALARRAKGLIDRHNALWIGVLEKALAHAAGLDRSSSELIEDASRDAARLTLEFERLRKQVESSCRQQLRSEIGMPGTAAAVALALAVLGGGCHSSRSLEGDAEDDRVELVDTAGEDSETECPPVSIHEHNIIVEAGVAAGCDDICNIISPVDWCEEVGYRFVIDETGHAVGMETTDGRPVPVDLESCYLEAVASQVFPCLQEHPYWEYCCVLLC